MITATTVMIVGRMPRFFGAVGAIVPTQALVGRVDGSVDGVTMPPAGIGGTKIRRARRRLGRETGRHVGGRRSGSGATASDAAGGTGSGAQGSGAADSGAADSGAADSGAGIGCGMGATGGSGANG